MVRGSTEREWNVWWIASTARQRQPLRVCMCVCWRGCAGSWKKGETSVPCVNSYIDLIQLNRTDLGVYQIPCGQVASIKAILQGFRRCVSACARQWMSWFVYLRTPQKHVHGGPNAGDSSCRNLHAYFCITCVCICVCFLFPCFLTWYEALSCVVLLPVTLSLCGPIWSWITASRDTHHEFLIHCMFLLEHRGSQCDPAEGRSFSGDCRCVWLSWDLS